MMTIQINNPTELLEFIKRDDVTTKQATEIVCKALNVISLFELTKKELIEQTEYCINTFFLIDCKNRPLILSQSNLELNIKDFAYTSEIKNIIDDLEAKY